MKEKREVGEGGGGGRQGATSQRRLIHSGLEF